MKAHFERWTQFLRRYSNRWWAAPLVGLAAFADLFVIVIPTDGLLVSAVMLSPRRWIYTGIMVALGSSLGAVALAAVLHTHGLPFLLHLKPGLDQSPIWVWSVEMMGQWGNWAIFGISLSPLMQHPVIALAALAGTPLAQIFAFVFLARLLKYLFLAWVATHAPKLLGKIWGLQYELHQTGIHPQAPVEPIQK